MFAVKFDTGAKGLSWITSHNPIITGQKRYHNISLLKYESEVFILHCGDSEDSKICGSIILKIKKIKHNH